MSSNDYQPISCDLHSEYELLAMHRKPVTVQYLDDQGAEQHFQGISRISSPATGPNTCSWKARTEPWKCGWIASSGYASTETLLFRKLPAQRRDSVLRKSHLRCP